MVNSTWSLVIVKKEKSPQGFLPPHLYMHKPEPECIQKPCGRDKLKLFLGSCMWAGKQGPEETSDFLAFYEVFVKQTALSVLLLWHFDYIIHSPPRLAGFGRHKRLWLRHSFSFCQSKELVWFKTYLKMQCSCIFFELLWSFKWFTEIACLQEAMLEQRK